MLRLTKLVTRPFAALTVLCLLTLTSAVSAQTRATAPPWPEKATEVLESFRPLLENVDHNSREGRELFAKLQQELSQALADVAPGLPPWTKGQADCQTACSLANTAKFSAALAKVHADTAAASSDPDCNSLYTDNAQYNAGLASAFATLGAVYACQGPASAQTAVVVLEDAEGRARTAWSNAWYSFTNGCVESYNTAVKASDASVELHNAIYYARSCN